MKQLHGLESLRQNSRERLGHPILAEQLLRDLRHCRCLLYGQREGASVLLAELDGQDDSLYYERFDQRIDLTLTGEIVRDDCVPLTYRLQGEHLVVTGRCSMLPKVCGVDWYIGAGYSGKAGERARLKFKIDVKEVLKKVLESQ
ncbi:hypothetical protein [Methylomarinum vadi]|uniref:hypothetical protein n=1 Tax=Methylomarinum vadi TaxID=438855 RepID=UPI0004DF49EE|nr:hypothetical protein [Methylomarinum vadi]